MTDYFEAIIAWIKEHKPNKDALMKKKMHFCKDFKLKKVPTDIEIYLNAKPEDLEVIKPYLQTKPGRTGSGVAVIATMTKPINCPHGTCTYCPGGLDSFYGDTPKSYTGKEPSTMRGIRNDYDAYRIIFNRLEQYLILGQNPDKAEQIVMGGTFTAFPKEYQDEYIYDSFKAYNDFSDLFFKDGELQLDKFKEFFELPGDINNPDRAQRIKQRILFQKQLNTHTLEQEQEKNETSSVRCIGLTIETKPDWGRLPQGKKLLELGTTRVELGIQTVYDDILKFVNRGHTIDETKACIAELRDLGFKLNFHMMPGLPEPDGTRISMDKDIESLKTIFDDDAYKPDMLKIYPCMVMPGTPLKQFFDKGIFKPISTAEAADIIVEAFRFIPDYCRVMRIQRDIPTYATTAGVDRTNLRQYVDQLAKERNIQLNDIRYREIRQEDTTHPPKLNIKEYTASGGKEFFISIDSGSKLLGFIRLRLPAKQLHDCITPTTAIIRELHVYGQAAQISKREDQLTQHKGYGKQLLERAELIAKQHGKEKLLVISGVGVREYYRKQGYQRDGPYMGKQL
ncbi:tRNA uridine(34) 5-carboxymethylaminomethyl modification radical SAM/GNAT enzyme Elp3 [Candidatus Woesearchaeota archaeon]|nr:tRNA uridine(34) 5-carboxymethylaminomethyl modification radical SAM/GNAT enzyme Elp3 [Candidatus Woesearchaeota archaeon]